MVYTLKGAKHGQKFKGNILGYYVQGKISIDKEGKIFFCTNNSNLDGEFTHNKFEYKHSWQLDQEVTSVQVLIKNKWVQIKKPESKIFGYGIHIDKDIIKFGCGAVKLHKKEIQDYVKGYRITQKYPGFKKVQNIIDEYKIFMDNKNFEKIKNLLKLKE